MGAVRVWSDGDRIDAIKLSYGDGTESAKIGGSGEPAVKEFQWKVPPGESITGIKVRAGWLIDGMQFQTDKGSISPLFGRGPCQNIITAGSDKSLLGLKGAAGEYLDSLDAHWGSRAPSRAPSRQEADSCVLS